MIGSSSANAMAGPMPGRTPTNVPMMHADRGVQQVLERERLPKPSSSSWRLSIRGSRPGCPARVARRGRRRRSTRTRPTYGADDQVTQQRLAAERPRAAGEQQRTGDGPAEDVDEHQVEHQDAEQLGDRDPVGRCRQVDVLALLGLRDVASSGRHGQQRRPARSSRCRRRTGRSAGRPDHRSRRSGRGRRSACRCRPAPSTAASAYCALSTVPVLPDVTHSSPRSLSVPETRSSCSSRKSSKSLPVLKSSVQPYLSSCFFHASLSCISSR